MSPILTSHEGGENRVCSNVSAMTNAERPISPKVDARMTSTRSKYGDVDPMATPNTARLTQMGMVI